MRLHFSLLTDRHLEDTVTTLGSDTFRVHRIGTNGDTRSKTVMTALPLPVSEKSPVLCRFLWVVARLRARIQIATLLGVYSYSPRPLQRYRSSSPQWGHLSAS